MLVATSELRAASLSWVVAQLLKFPADRTFVESATGKVFTRQEDGSTVLHAYEDDWASLSAAMAKAGALHGDRPSFGSIVPGVHVQQSRTLPGVWFASADGSRV